MTTSQQDKPKCQSLPINCSDCSQNPIDCEGSSDETKMKLKKRQNEEEELYEEEFNEERWTREAMWDRLTEGGHGSG